jgi:MerR family transcriptional regulator, light-induced transcriptional regulator
MAQPHDPADAGLRITAVSDMCGLSVHTIRAWERRYGVPSPPRSAGRQRLYSRRDVDALRRMNELARSGVPLASAAQTVRREQERGEDSEAQAPSALPSLNLFVASLLEFDEARAAEYWGAYLAGTSLDALLDAVVVPTLQRIGDGWHAGIVSVAQEHFASAFLRSRLESLARQHTPSRTAPAVVLACLPDNWHEISILILHVVLRYRGLRTVYLGQSVPFEDIVRTAGELRPRVLVLHGFGEEAANQLRELVPAVAEASPSTRIIYGGRTFDGDDAPVIEGAHYGGATLAEGATAIENAARQPA